MSITTAGGLHVKSIWSKAGVGTTVHVQGVGRQASILFDCGHLDETEYSAKHVFISHGHVDHIGSCITHARGRALNGKPATYYVPPRCVEPLKEALRAFEVLDENSIPMNIVPFSPFDVAQISPAYKVFAFPTEHRVVSQGYAVIHSRRGSLFPQYANCTQEEIIELRKQKVRVHGEENTVEVVYTGDSTMQGLIDVPEKFNDYLRKAQFSGDNDNDGGGGGCVSCHPVLQTINLDFMFTAEMLIMEMTYLDGDGDKAGSRGHIHLQDLLTNGHMFNNRQIILMHVSSKYGCQQIIDILGRSLTAQLKASCAVALSSFGDDDAIRPTL